jgi:hypothetical protein
MFLAKRILVLSQEDDGKGATYLDTQALYSNNEHIGRGHPLHC